jgi:hypothetical protein
MCLICQSLDEMSITPWEARRNLQEMQDSIPKEHIYELVKKINEMD